MRVPWPQEFPPVLVQTHWQIGDRSSLPGLFDHPQYSQAKRGGSVAAALEVVSDVVQDSVLDDIVDCFGYGPPIVVAPASTPEELANALPITYAQFLGHELEIDVAEHIYQARGPKRDGKGAWYRIANPPSFYIKEGYHNEVEGRDVIIVDDVFTLGGTLAALRSFIENQGGNVIATSALAHRTGQHVQIALARITKSGLDRAYGPDLDGLWREEFGHGTECLTEPEGQLLLRTSGIDRIRKAIDGERDADVSRGGQGATGE